MSRFLVMKNLGLCLLALILACAPQPAPAPILTPLAPTAASPLPPPPSAAAITGTVLDPEGSPIPGATVRVKATKNKTVSASDGSFTLHGLSTDEPVLLTAWAPGAFNGGETTKYYPGESNVKIVLEPLPTDDNQAYQWLSAFTSGGQSGNCENCHSALAPEASLSVGAKILPFEEWQKDAHALSTGNPRFLSMYLGRDLQGNQSPLTRYGYSRDYGRIPLRPDLTQPYHGPGYKLDFPDTAGNCAACHLPAAAIDDPYGIDPTTVGGTRAEGITCDFCHKIDAVKLDPGTGLPHPNTPGVLSFEFLRPPDGHQFFAGPLDDVAPGEDTYSPIQQQSQFCAPCHYGTFWGTTIYNSFGEWLASPYNDPLSGKTCQDCHMPPSGAAYIAQPDKGAVERNPETIFSHLMPGGSNANLLQKAVTMNVSAWRAGDKVAVTVTIVNDKTGHDVPSDSPLRQMILLVQARAPDGTELTQIDGPAIPDYGGIGDPAKGYYAGQAGKIYAKILMELWTEVTPTAAYWNPTRVVSDNRIPTFGSDSATYTFNAPVQGDASIQVRLLYRRAFIQLMDWKSWAVPDIVMDQKSLVVP
jgi:hypothetical protein